jgi:hypothetical protein
MQVVANFLRWLQATSLAVFIHEHRWAFMTIEIAHVLCHRADGCHHFNRGLAPHGARLLQRAFTELARQLLRVTWTAFVDRRAYRAAAIHQSGR